MLKIDQSVIYSTRGMKNLFCWLAEQQLLLLLFEDQGCLKHCYSMHAFSSGSIGTVRPNLRPEDKYEVINQSFYYIFFVCNNFIKQVAC